MTSVAVGTGTTGATLTSNLFYDSRGNLVQSQPAGGVVTVNMYNGLGEEFESVDEASPGGTELTETDNDYDADEELDEEVITRFGLGVVPNQVDYSGVYRDSAGREVAMVDVGNNGGSVWSMPASPPARSSTALVTTFGYNEQDEQVQSVDPNGLITTSTFDALGQALSSVADASGSANGSDGSGAQNKTTVMTYGPAGELSLTAVNGSVSQTTGYGYGVRVGQGDTINSNDLLAVTEYPDPTTGLASTARNETVVDQYDDQGQVLTSTDRNGNVHSYRYDSLGRETLDAVTTLGTGVDGTVRAIGTSYNDQGNVWFTTSYSSPTPGNGAILNQVEDVYDGFGQVVQEYQAVSGGVVVGSTPSVQYTYAEGGSNSDRLTSMVYPDGYQVDLVYNSGTDSSVSRVSSLADDQTVDGNSTTLEAYGYLGVGGVLTRTDQAQTQTVTLDTFGRVGTEAWTTSAGTTSSYTYTYDADSNVLTKTDNVNSSLSQTYTYDGLNQVTSYAESSGTQSQSYTYDSLGNRTGVATNGSSSETWSANAQNEITSVGTTGSAPIYDADGNMTADQTGLVYTYDAWNRLVKVSSSAGTLETMSYDGLSRLVVDTNAGVPTNRYYSLADQVLEEQSGGVYTARYVWSEVYVNALVFRDANASGLSATSSYTRVWAQQDANFNVMTLVGASGAVVERFDYSAFGLQTVIQGSTAWVYGFQGMRLDSVTGWVESQSRWYSPSLGSWTSVDPLGFAGGDVREYGFERNNYIGKLDPSGAQPLPDGALPKPLFVDYKTNDYGTFALYIGPWDSTKDPFLTPEEKKKPRSGIFVMAGFAPKVEKCDCTKVAVVQVAMGSVDGTTIEGVRPWQAKNGYFVDTLPGNHYGYYGWNNDGTMPKNADGGYPGRYGQVGELKAATENERWAIMLDRPHNTEFDGVGGGGVLIKTGERAPDFPGAPAPAKPVIRKRFVTAWIALDGADKGKILGCWSWSDGSQTSGDTKPQFGSEAAIGDLRKAVESWNEYAKTNKDFKPIELK